MMMVMMLIMMIVMRTLYHTEILLKIRPTDTNSQTYTDSHRYRHTNAHTYARLRTCSHTNTHTFCMYAYALIQVNKHGWAHMHTTCTIGRQLYIS